MVNMIKLHRNKKQNKTGWWKCQSGKLLSTEYKLCLSVRVLWIDASPD